MKKIKPILDIPNCKVVNIIFDDNTSHFSIVQQFVLSLLKNKYASKKEIIESLKEYLLNK